MLAWQADAETPYLKGTELQREDLLDDNELETEFIIK